MSNKSRLQIALVLSASIGLLLSACQPPASAPSVVPTNTPVVTVLVAAPATLAPSATSTRVPDTPTAAPTDTSVPTHTDMPTATAPPTATASPTVAPTNTPLPTAAAKPTARPTARPTAVPPTAAPTDKPAQPVAASIYSFADGPAGYMTAIKCERNGVACTSVMSPGDISFQMLLSSDASAPWTHFVNYGLSVEKDGANVANMFMFVDAGWLKPGTLVWFGSSRNFSQPGTYVIRSSGCITTDQNSNDCAWTTMPGDVVTIVVQ